MSGHPPWSSTPLPPRSGLVSNPGKADDPGDSRERFPDSHALHPTSRYDASSTPSIHVHSPAPVHRLHNAQGFPQLLARQEAPRPSHPFTRPTAQQLTANDGTLHGASNVQPGNTVSTLSAGTTPGSYSPMLHDVSLGAMPVYMPSLYDMSLSAAQDAYMDGYDTTLDGGGLAAARPSFNAGDRWEFSQHLPHSSTGVALGHDMTFSDELQAEDIQLRIRSGFSPPCVNTPNPAYFNSLYQPACNGEAADLGFISAFPDTSSPQLSNMLSASPLPIYPPFSSSDTWEGPDADRGTAAIPAMAVDAATHSISHPEYDAPSMYTELPNDHRLLPRHNSDPEGLATIPLSEGPHSPSGTLAFQSTSAWPAQHRPPPQTWAYRQHETPFVSSAPGSPQSLLPEHAGADLLWPYFTERSRASSSSSTASDPSSSLAPPHAGPSRASSSSSTASDPSPWLFPPYASVGGLAVPPSALTASSSSSSAATSDDEAWEDASTDMVTTDRVAAASSKRRKKAPRFECTLPDCASTFTTRVNFESHMDAHYGDKRHRCLSCGDKFRRLSDMKRHARKHTGDTAKAACDICHKTFTRKDTLKAHRKKAHSS